MSVNKAPHKRAYLKQKPNPRMRTILDPRVRAQIGRANGQREIRLSDYIAVPAILTNGTWSAKELLPRGQLAALARFANALERW